MTLQQILELIICSLVDDAEAVRLTADVQATQTMFRVQVAPTDVGKLIGKQGRTARALRTILGAASVKDGHQYSLDIVEVH